MQRHIPNYSSNQQYVVLLTIVSYLLVSFIDGILVVEGFLFTPSAGIAIPLGILFGFPAAVGVTAGAFLSDVLSLNISLNTLVYSIALFILSYIAHISYQYGIGTAVVSSETPVKSVTRFIFVVIIACSVSAAFLAFGYELTGISPFYVSVIYGFIEFLLATVVVAPLIGLPIMYSQRLSTYTLPRNNDSIPPRISRWSFILVPPVWILFGTVGSVGFRIRERIALVEFQRRNIDFIYHIIHPDIFGQGGRRAQVVFGTLMLFLLFISVRQAQKHIEGDM